MRLDRRRHRRQMRQSRRIIFADQQIDRRTAGRDPNLPGLGGDQLLIFGFDEIRAFGRFERSRKLQFPQRRLQGLDGTMKIGDGGWRQAGDDGLAGGDGLPQLGDFTDRPFCFLRANDRALAAQDALRRVDLGAVVFHLDRLHRTMPDTFITVFAMQLVKLQNIHASASFSPGRSRFSPLLARIPHFRAHCQWRRRGQKGPQIAGMATAGLLLNSTVRLISFAIFRWPGQRPWFRSHFCGPVP